MTRAFRTLSMAVLSLSLAACASAGSYPSLARRDAERIAGSAAPAPAETTAPAAPAQPDAALAARLAALVEQARSAHHRFTDTRPRAESLAASAAGSAVASEAWSVATVAIAELESARSQAMIAMADLDAINAADRVANPNDPGADAPAIAAARDQVAGWIAEEDAVLASLKGRLRS